MEISMKQKMIVTLVMALFFAGSILVKSYFQDQQGILVEAAGSGMDSEQSVGDESVDGVIPTEEELSVIVDVEGAVANPGIVRLEEGSRVYQAIEKAGGILENADTKYINQAEEALDGTIIYVPFLEGNRATGGAVLEGSTEGTTETGEQNETALEGAISGPVNINAADMETLMTLPGIGESYASAIIAYREEKGYFQSIEELKNIEGIGDKKFEKLQDLVSIY